MQNESTIKLGQLIAKARTKVGLSQDELAKLCHKSRTTIANWENGYTSPSLEEILDMFNKLHLNPVPYLEEYLYSKSNASFTEMSPKKRRLLEKVSNMSDKYIDDLTFLLSGKNGSSAYCFMQMCVADAQTPLKDRQMVATIIANNYKLAQYMGDLICTEETEVDVEALDKAIELGTDAVKSHSYGYSKN